MTLLAVEGGLTLDPHWIEAVAIPLAISIFGWFIKDKLETIQAGIRELNSAKEANRAEISVLQVRVTTIESDIGALRQRQHELGNALQTDALERRRPRR